MFRIHLLSRVLPLAFALLLASCAGLPGRIEPPQVSLSDIGLIDVGVLEQRFMLRLRIQNPNAFELPIEGLSYDVEVNGQPFAHGVSNRPMRVPGYGSSVLEVEAVSNLAGLVRQFREMERRQGGFDYRIRGRLSTGKYSPDLPFDHRGEVSLFGASKDRSV